MHSIRKYLAGLSHSGISGFEGFVAMLLESATGQRFRLARSGTQGGRDAGSESRIGANRILIECKHYTKSSLDNHDLIKGLDDALESQPDLWILVASCPAPDQIQGKLEYKSRHEGFEVLILDVGLSGLSRLHVLMAWQHEVLSRWPGLAEDQRYQQILIELAHVRSDPRYEGEVRQLREKLNGSLLGYADAQARAREYVRRILRSKGSSLKELGQNLGIRNCGSTVIERGVISRTLDEWWLRAKSSPAHAVVLGEEGMGKSWATLDWLDRKLPSLPLTLVMSASGSHIPLESTIEQVIPSLLQRATGIRTDWEARLTRWLTAANDSEGPLLLIVVDGLNERFSVKWANFFRTLEGEPWSERVRVLVTDRTGHWNERCSASLQDSFAAIPVERYTSAELDSALAQHGLKVGSIPNDLRSLISIPRYCGLVIEHYSELTGSLDPTIERLMLIDARARLSRSRNHPISMDQFDEILRSLARKQIEARRIRREDVRALAKEIDPEIEMEVLTGGVLVSEGHGAFRVDRERLIYGLGLVIADDVRTNAEAGADLGALGETLARWFEPHNDMDLKVRFAASAMFLALRDESYPERGRHALVAGWLQNHNQANEDVARLIMHFERFPQDIQTLAEWAYSSNSVSDRPQITVADAVLECCTESGIRQALVEVVERWLSLVHLEGRPRGIDGSRREDDAKRMRERLGTFACVGRQRLWEGVEVEVVADGGLLGLTHLGIRVIASGSRTAFKKALSNWAVADTVMDHGLESDEVGWAVRLTDEDLEDLLLEDAGAFARLGGELGMEAARLLCRVLGTRKASVLLGSLPRKPESATWRKWREEQEKDPCTGWLAWSDADCARCGERLDIPVGRIAERFGHRVFDPSFRPPASFVKRCLSEMEPFDPTHFRASRSQTLEEESLRSILPVIARYAPDRLASFHRRIAASLPSREGAARSQLAQWLPRLALILGKEDVGPLLSLRRSMTKRLGDIDIADGEKQELAHLDGQIIRSVGAHLGTSRTLRLATNPATGALTNPTVLPWLGPASTPAARLVLDRIHTSTSLDTATGLMLALTKTKNIKLLPHDVEMFVELVTRSDDFTRAVVCWLATLSNSVDLGHRLIEAGALPARAPGIDFGPELLLRCGDGRTFAQLIEMVDARAASRLLRLRGNHPDEVAAYAEKLDLLVCDAAAHGEPAQERGLWPKRWAPRELADSEMHFDRQALRAIREQTPDIFHRWVSMPSSNVTGMRRCRGFLRDVSLTLLEREPELGWKMLDGFEQSGFVPTLNKADVAFFAEESAITSFRRWEAVLAVEDDHELTELCKHAFRHRQVPWMRATVDSLVKAEPLWRRAHGLTVASLLDYSIEEFDRLVRAADIDRTWVSEVVVALRERVQLDACAQHWANAFTQTPDPTEAWAALNLLVKCGDHRLGLHMNAGRSALRARDREIRRRYVATLASSLEDQVERNHKPARKDHRFGMRNRAKIRPFALSP